MKAMNLWGYAAALLLSHSIYATCDVTKTARQTVKAFAAIQDIQGITSYVGSVLDSNQIFTRVLVQTRYSQSHDNYIVQVRNSDCRILSANLEAEALP